MQKLRQECKDGWEEYQADEEDNKTNYVKDLHIKYLVQKHPFLSKQFLKKQKLRKLILWRHKPIRQRNKEGRNPVYDTTEFIAMSSDMIRISIVLNKGSIKCACSGDCVCWEMMDMVHSNQQKKVKYLKQFENRFNYINIADIKPNDMIKLYCKTKILSSKYPKKSINLLSSKKESDRNKVIV